MSVGDDGAPGFQAGQRRVQLRQLLGGLEVPSVDGALDALKIVADVDASPPETVRVGGEDPGEG